MSQEYEEYEDQQHDERPVNEPVEHNVAVSPKQKKDWVPPAIKKYVTKPILQLTPGAPVYVKVTSKLYEEKLEGSAIAAPAPMIDVTDLYLEQPFKMILNTVLYKELFRAYPDHEYVGKSLMITMFKPSRKDYFTYTIAELED